MEKVLVKTFKNGNKLWKKKVRCWKCSGTGKVIWTYMNGICFDCNGNGWVWENEREYTPENLAKQEAIREKKAAEMAAKKAEIEAERAAREAAWKAEQEEMERRRRGHYYGEVGQTIEVDVLFVGAVSYDTIYGTVNLHKFDTDDGAHLVWKTSSEIGGRLGSKGCKIVDEGDRIRIRATIKAHNEYREIEQTELVRVKLISGGRDPE